MLDDLQRIGVKILLQYKKETPDRVMLLDLFALFLCCLGRWNFFPQTNNIKFPACLCAGGELHTSISRSLSIVCWWGASLHDFETRRPSSGSENEIRAEALMRVMLSPQVVSSLSTVCWWGASRSTVSCPVSSLRWARRPSRCV